MEMHYTYKMEYYSVVKKLNHKIYKKFYRQNVYY